MPDDTSITPKLLLEAYCAGYFPMARAQRGRTLYWFNPEIRGVLPLGEVNAFHTPRSLARFLRRCPFTVTADAAFEQVIHACADNRREGREDTWINRQIIDLYTDLHRMGYAHSVEVWEGTSSVIPAKAEICIPETGVTDAGLRWHDDKTLVGGVYGVSIGGAFFGESMFSTRTNASKVALVHLVRRLQAAGYGLLDAQFENRHLTQFGFRGIAREDYLSQLRHALSISPNPSSRFLTVSVNRL